MYDLPDRKLSEINDFSSKCTTDDEIYMTALTAIRCQCRNMMEDISLVDELMDEYKMLDELLYNKLPKLTQQRIDLVKSRKADHE